MVYNMYDGQPEECDDCGGSGSIFIRPSGHTFQYPGGPASGSCPAGLYDLAKPYVVDPFCYRFVDIAEELIL